MLIRQSRLETASLIIITALEESLGSLLLAIFYFFPKFEVFFAGRRRFITREHTSDTSEADTFSTKTPEKGCEKRNLGSAVHRIGDAR